MRLDAWLREQNMTDAQFAELANVSRECARLWRMGARNPSATAAAHIDKLTNGKVRRADLAAAATAYAAAHR